MVANVLLVIIPAHRKLVRAMEEKREPDPVPLLRAKERSVHNNYLTLPVLFTMLIGHFAFVFGADDAWLVFVLVALLTALIRVFFNHWHAGRRVWWIPAVATVGVVALALWLRPDDTPAQTGQPVSFAEVQPIIEQRCATCHSGASAPLGVRFETQEQIESRAEDIRRQAVETRAMPPGNATGITEEERDSSRRGSRRASSDGVASGPSFPARRRLGSPAVSIVTGRRGLVAFIAAACTGVALLGGASTAAPLFTSASSSATQAPSTSLTISRPAAAGSGTVLVAAVAFRADAAAPLVAPGGLEPGRPDVVRRLGDRPHTGDVRPGRHRLGARVVHVLDVQSDGRGRLDPRVHGHRPRSARPRERGRVHTEHEGGEPGDHDEHPADEDRRRLLSQRHSDDHEPARHDEPFRCGDRRELADDGAPDGGRDARRVAGSYTRKAQAQVKQDCNVGQLVALRSAPDPPANTSLADRVGHGP